MTTANIPIPEDIDELVAKYVKLRDKIKEADDAHKKKTADAREFLDRMGNKMLEKLIAMGGESVKTKAGTVYRTTRRTASIADGQVFRQFVIDNVMYDIVDWKANANAVDDFIKSNGAPPPGVNFNTAYTVGVRRA